MCHVVRGKNSQCVFTSLVLHTLLFPRDQLFLRRMATGCCSLAVQFGVDELLSRYWFIELSVSCLQCVNRSEFKYDFVIGRPKRT